MCLKIGVIPFTSKILESCKKSLAYQPPNPWTMAILGLLAEIHAMKNLKANLKFEIKILFKNLNVDLKEVTPSSLLKNRVRIVEGNPDFPSNSSGSYLKQKDKVTSNSTVRSVVNQVKSPVVAAGPSDQAGHTFMPPTAASASYQSHVLHKNADRLHPPTVMLGENEKKASLGSPNQLPPAQRPQVAQFPNVIPLRAPIIPDLENFCLNKFFRRLFSLISSARKTNLISTFFCSVLPTAMKMALEEVISSFVKRSVSLATTTTIELILKDYSTELDDDYIVSASCRMVSRLAGELTYVTSKEPLREKLSTNLRNSLHGLNVANNLIEHAMQPVIHENLKSGCDFIEKAAIDEGQTIVTREITEKLSVRRKHREVFHPRPGDFSFFQHQVLQAQKMKIRIPNTLLAFNSSVSYPACLTMCVFTGFCSITVAKLIPTLECLICLLFIHMKQSDVSLFALSHLAWKIVVQIQESSILCTLYKTFKGEHTSKKSTTQVHNISQQNKSKMPSKFKLHHNANVFCSHM
ncbi:CCR4-Not complex component, Not1, C-terminal [Artemisia annua]|uniref:CCR4-Not complex component, Not1, C-terminal n=1 Tax=Artemisia annua TaxID=35608 RepID=A0A2U1MJS0_ARTAN|nr:CCR4-Not complex component, Not1, C-terminal [Artemisia annua]